jgi:hypothetical protein
MRDIKHRLKLTACAATAMLALVSGAAQAETAAATPPMGWNPYNAFHIESNEANIMSVAEALVKTGLADAGYKYVNVDDGWWLKRRADGRIIVNTAMFPSAAATTPGGETSLRPFVDKLHAMGLKAGIYTDIGRNACSQAWDHKSPNLPVGTQAEREIGAMDYQKQDMQLMFGEWNFDYIKVDACGLADYQPEKPYVSDGTYRAYGPTLVRGKPNPADDAKVEALYASLSQEIAAVRPKGDTVLSICSWGEGSVAEWGNKYGNLWRTSGDIRATWKSMLSNFDSAAAHPDKAGPGHWNDPDMLEIGNGEFDANHLTEARSHMSLWAIINSPLLLGSDITKWPQSLVDVAGNREVIAVNQDALGKQGIVVSKTDVSETVVKELADGGRAVALINRSSTPVTVSVSRAQLGLSGKLTLRDLWTHKDQPLKGDAITVSLTPHETALYRVRKP